MCEKIYAIYGDFITIIEDSKVYFYPTILSVEVMCTNKVIVN